jgi:putative glycosyltransferase (TIGR04372 family)
MMICFFIPFVLILRLAKPFIFIRVGYFFSDRIGHFATDVEYYLSRQEHTVKTEKSYDFFFLKGVPCNIALVELMRRKIRIHKMWEFIYRANVIVPGGLLHCISPDREINGSRDVKRVLEETSQQLNFNTEESMFGEDYLRSTGCPPGVKFVCLFVRDGSYLASRYDRDFGYHDYRDSNIDSYKKVALALAQKGYWVYRMGKVVESPFHVDNTKIVDYATSKKRTDLLDIWLMANCYFAISTSAGLDAIPEIFRRPIVFVNHLPVGNLKTGNKQHIELFKKVISQETKKPLSLREHIESGAIHCLKSHVFRSMQLEIIDNSEDEITDVVLEMEARLSGDWVNNPTDDDLQGRFYSILKTWDQYSEKHGSAGSRISAHFLRKHHDWFLV